MSCEIKPPSPNKYTGIDCCIPEDRLSNSQKKERCCQIGKYIVYVATFFEGMIDYIQCKISMIQGMVDRVETSEIKIGAALDRVEELCSCICIPTEATYSKDGIDELQCFMANTTVYNKMEEVPCCCKPYIKLIG